MQAFMAGVLKDYGLVREAATLYGRAATLAPRSVSYALNWLHALELCNEPVKALEVRGSDIRVAPSRTRCREDCEYLSLSRALETRRDDFPRGNGQEVYSLDPRIKCMDSLF